MPAVLCSTNEHKLAELAALLPMLDLRPADPGMPEPIEDGDSFEDNARIKAVAGAAYHPDVLVIADDSGLCVDALGGAPGVLSARFAGPGASDTDNVDRLLTELDTRGAMSGPDRRARFECVLVAVRPGGEELVARGAVHGTIARTRSGSNGFGYDPVFIPDGHEETFGVLPSSLKHELSHRAEAARALARALRNRVAASG